jgi:hypothetical protein
MLVKSMKAIALLALASLVLSGCARSTIESRKQERYAAYSALNPNFRTKVDQGQIDIGMPKDAVYIAWGKPSQTITAQGPEGSKVTWVYMGTRLESYHYWTQGPSYGYYRKGHGYYGGPYLAHGYYPKDYLSAEVFFETNEVKSWRQLDYND